MTLAAGGCPEYIGALSGQKVSVSNGKICVNVKADSGDIWVPYSENASRNILSAPTVVEKTNVDEIHTQAASTVAVAEEETITVTETVTVTETAIVAETAKASNNEAASEKNTEPHTEQAANNTPNSEEFEQGKIAGLQEAIIAIMEKKGPVTEQMKRDVYNNTHHASLITWVKSFH